MLGGERTFHDRLCWILVLPLSGLAFFAANLATQAVALAVMEDAPPEWYETLALALAAFVSTRAGAATAPAKKLRGAAMTAAALCAAALVLLSRGRGARSALAFALRLAALPAGAAAGCVAARGLPDDPIEEESKK